MRLWEVVGGCVRLWEVVEGCGRLWEVVGGCGGLWEVVGGCGRLWEVVGGCGRLWEVVGGCGRRLWEVARIQEECTLQLALAGCTMRLAPHPILELAAGEMRRAWPSAGDHQIAASHARSWRA